jgi:tRNA threonylcarbamoyladenosine biosynthesis protein TsaB
MIILASETSTSTVTVAVCRGDAGQGGASVQLLAESVVEADRSHSERLLDTVRWLLCEARLTLEDVSLLATGIGPGSLTGVRVGVAAWKGLAAARNLPLLGVHTLEAMTWLMPGCDTVFCPLLDARMREVFGAAFRNTPAGREKVLEDRVCAIEEIVAELPDETLYVGDGAWVYRDRLLAVRPSARIAPAFAGMPRASAVAAEAMEILRRNPDTDTDPAHLIPSYLREAKVQLNPAIHADAHREGC